MGVEVAENPDAFQHVLRRAALSLWHGALSVLTPSRCLACHVSLQGSAVVCSECFQKLKLIDDPVCDVMGTPFAYDQGAGVLSPQALSHPPPWDKARAAVVFDDVSKAFVHAYKYGDRSEASLFMAKHMLRAGRELLPKADLIVPVPLHWTRLWWRRFNQAGALSQMLARASGKPYRPFILKRSRATPQQVGLDAKARAKNMREAFVVPRPDKIKGKVILLVDDVRTTGATVSSCVEALKKADAGQVFVLTFAVVNHPFRPRPAPEQG